MAKATKSQNPSTRKPLTFESLREVLDYDPDTGIFLWKAREATTPSIKMWNGRYAGKKAGGLYRDYIEIAIDDENYYGHRLAVFYMTGEWPEHGVDHEDLDGSNNTWTNIRSATKSQNAANTTFYKTNTSGIKGVCWHKRARRWQAQIKCQGKYKFLGTFKSKEAAGEVYAKAARELFGDFARVT